jgi:hypothetical protein
MQRHLTGVKRREQTDKRRRELFPKFTTERARELRAFAEQLAAKEAAGEGIDFSGVETRHAQEQAALQAERRERREREKPEAATR